MRDFAIGILFGSTVWFLAIASVVAKAERRISALSHYNGALEERIQRLNAIYNGLVGNHDLSVIKGGRD